MSLPSVTYDLREGPRQRKRRAKTLRAIYALVDPTGWDARRLNAQATAHTRAGVAGHVSDGQSPPQ